MHKIVLGMLFVSYTYAAGEIGSVTAYEDQSMWTALYALAIIGMSSLFLSSYRLKHATRKHKEALRLKDEMNVKHRAILETMSHNIEVSAKGIRRYKEVIKQNDFKSISEDIFKKEMYRFEENETLLLDTTHELIDFLQIQSDSLEIIEEPYKLNNTLNDIYGFISDYIKEYKTELIYDISPDVATELHGDSKRIAQVLRTFLIDMISGAENTLVILKVSSTENEKGQLIFQMHNRDKMMLDEEIKALFSSYAISENYKSKEKLDLYVAYELVKQMGGTLDVKSSQTDGTTYRIELPYKPIKTSLLKSQKSKDKRLLILEDDAQRSQLLLNIMQQHDMKIDCADSQSLVSHMPNFYNYDMVIVNTKLLFLTIVEKLDKVKKEKPLIVIETYNSYEKKFTNKRYQLIDASIQKPLQSEQIYTLLENSFEKNSAKNDHSVEAEKESSPVLKNREGVTVDSFSKFSHMHILIVEDNSMNQKILRGVLRNSGIAITMVNNGQEALDEIQKNSDLDLIFMDTNMPVMDGYEATKKIRETFDKRQLPIVAISAIGFKNDIVKMKKAGANTFLHKPFQLGELFSAFSMFEAQSKGKIKNIDHKLTKYKANVEILDIDKGIKQANSAVFYKELLEEVLANLTELDSSVVKWINKRKDVKTYEFISHALKLSETIGATAFVKILKEMNLLFIHKEEKRLQEYLPLYTKEWNRLKSEIETYLKS